MTTALTLRAVKGSPLTHSEVDANFTALRSTADGEQGFLLPSMTTTQRDAIVTPAPGLMVFNTTTSKLNFYDGGAWRVVTST